MNGPLCRLPRDSTGRLCSSRVFQVKDEFLESDVKSEAIQMPALTLQPAQLSE